MNQELHTQTKTAIIILAAGQGTRMKSSLPKILHPLGGKPMIHHMIDVTSQLSPAQTIVVISPHLDQNLVKGGRTIDLAVQPEPLGTGDAVKAALYKLHDDIQDLIIICGDMPLIQAEDLHKFMASRDNKIPEILMLAMDLDDPRQYGRLKTNGPLVECIIEHKDLKPEEHSLRLCNSGIYLVPRDVLTEALKQLNCQNSAGEYYLTDMIAHAKKAGITTRYVLSQAPDTLHGINNRVELAQAEQCLQQRWRHYHMLAGVTMIAPDTVILSYDTIIGPDTVIYPNVFIGPEVMIGTGVTLYSGCFLMKSTLGDGTKVGPYAHLRDGTILESQSEIGNFVECKKSRFGPKAKAKHLSYLGDAQIGEKANIGAGTITCNYDGFKKSQTIIENGAFIGSNCSLIAPIVVEENAIVSAGSVITQNVPAGSMAIARSHQENKLEWAARFREASTKRKESGR